MEITITILTLTLILSGIIHIINIKNFKFIKKLLLDKEISYSKLLSQKKSSEVRLGQISENLAPFLKDFKYDPKKTHFMGMPIDYIIFEEDQIIFLEIKSGKAQLSTKQRHIRDLIKEGKVIWDEMRIN